MLSCGWDKRRELNVIYTFLKGLRRQQILRKTKCDDNWIAMNSTSSLKPFPLTWSKSKFTSNVFRVFVFDHEWFMEAGENFHHHEDRGKKYWKISVVVNSCVPFHCVGGYLPFLWWLNPRLWYEFTNMKSEIESSLRHGKRF